MRKWTFTSLEVLVEQVRKRNLRSFRSPGRRDVWKAELYIFASRDRADVWKRSFRSAEAEFHIFGSQDRTEVLHIFGGIGRAEVRNGIHIMGSQCRAEMLKRNFTSLVVKAVWKRNFRSLAVNAERKCGNGTSDL